jgi:hypothetical protein
VPTPVKGPAEYETTHCTGKRRKRRIEKGIAASQGKCIVGAETIKPQDAPFVSQLDRRWRGSQQTAVTWDQAIDQQPQDVQAILAASWQ